MFLLTKLPAAFLAGLQLKKLTAEEAVVSVRHKWLNQNPFGSLYFAVLSMAAEATTGILSMSALYKRKPPVSMLIVKNEGFFYKKATGKIIFTCTDGKNILKAVEQSVQTGEGTIVTCNSKGINEAGELVAEFNFTWSFKAKK
ncbi:MAG: hypothetical protein JWQ09_1440 [Segetibacter sp.]|nr:hypothetical protein [Segetibacter sp.]